MVRMITGAISLFVAMILMTGCDGNTSAEDVQEETVDAVEEAYDATADAAEEAAETAGDAAEEAGDEMDQMTN